MDVQCVLPAAAELGEGPVWCDVEQALYWVDIRAPTLHRFDPETQMTRSWTMPEPVGCVALGPPGWLVVALASGLAWFASATETLERFLPIEANNVATRLNDGRCDRQGRLWVGSMGMGTPRTPGTLYRCTEKAATAMIDNIGVPNTTAFSPDGRRMYFSDTPTRRIRVFDLDPASGALSNERLFAAVAEDQGGPDGACMDAEGCLWVAQWDGSRVTRFRPDGTVERTLHLPVPRPTCCCFGGSDLDTLFITSARTGLDDAALHSAPLSGGVFAVKPGPRGLRESRFGVGD